MPQSISSEASVSESQTSTLEYGQESFETFKDRVSTLCTSLWPSVPAEAITIERMRGGSSNRVIGITFSKRPENPSDDEPVVEKYVLRIPRFEGDRIEPELATLFFVQDKVSAISVPEVVAFDLTHDNPINEVYTVQKRLPGVRLVDIYTEISQAEKLSIISQLSQIIHNMHKIRSPLPGLIDATKFVVSDENGKLVPEVGIVDFITKTMEDQELDRGRDNSAKPKSTLQLFIDQFDGWQAFGQRHNRSQGDIERMNNFCTAARQMEQLGFLKGDIFFCFMPISTPKISWYLRITAPSGK